MEKSPVEITVDEKQLKGLHARLSAFMKDLPGHQKDAMAVILARAAAAREQDSDMIDDHLFAVGKEPGEPTLPMLARALDGKSEFQSENGTWFYTIWTYTGQVDSV